jgi:SAM-dependent methyltransferase
MTRTILRIVTMGHLFYRKQNRDDTVSRSFIVISSNRPEGMSGQKGATLLTNKQKPSPYDDPERYDLLFESFDIDLPFWLKVARDAGGPVLEAGCGTGRVLLRLLEAGVDADGFDSSRPMIGGLRAKARKTGWEDRAIVADMREFSLPRRYARVICAFNGFAHCETTEDQIRALRCFLEHLEPGGALVLHMSYPGPSYWTEPDGVPTLEIEAKIPATGRMVQMWDTRTKDPVAQLQRSEVEIREINKAGRTVASHRSVTSQRWIYRYELELLFRTAGYSRWTIWGGFEGKPLADPQDQMIAWAWKD